MIKITELEKVYRTEEVETIALNKSVVMMFQVIKPPRVDLESGFFLKWL